MPKGIWRLTVTEEFSASHQLRGYDGACERLHGHNFGVEVEVEGDRLSGDLEILLDFKELKAMLREVLAELDHRHLNDLPAFAAHNPSSENLARHLYQALAPRLAAGASGGRVRLRHVAVSEKESSKATYTEE